MKDEELFNRVKDSKKESKIVDFKETLDINSSHDWAEIIKDIVAMANSGGGYLLIGVHDDGSLSQCDVSALLAFDLAKVTDKIAKYTNEQFSDLQIIEADRGCTKIAVIVVNGVKVPMVFTKSGDYTVHDKQKVAFAQGTLYFRHGSKSEPANHRDIEKCIEREVERNRKYWLGGIRKVVKAPVESRISVLPAVVNDVGAVSLNVAESQNAAATVRLTDNPNAPIAFKMDTNKTHPYRLRHVAKIVTERLNGKRVVTTGDIQHVRQAHNIDNSNLNYIFKPNFKGLSPQYSESFIDWVVSEYEKDNAFFTKAYNKLYGELKPANYQGSVRKIGVEKVPSEP